MQLCAVDRARSSAVWDQIACARLPRIPHAEACLLTPITVDGLRSCSVSLRDRMGLRLVAIMRQNSASDRRRIPTAISHKSLLGAKPMSRPTNSDVASTNLTVGRITIRARYATSRIENAEYMSARTTSPCAYSHRRKLLNARQRVRWRGTKRKGIALIPLGVPRMNIAQRRWG